MHKGKRIIEVAGRAAAISLGAIILAIALSCGALAASAGDTAAASPKVRELLTSLAREWLGEQGEAKSAIPPAQQTSSSFADYVNSDAGAIHDQIIALASAIPSLPHEFERANPRRNPAHRTGRCRC